MLARRLYLVLFLFAKRVNSCEVNVTISKEKQINDTHLLFDGIIFNKNHTFVENNILKGCICEYRTCLRKCCALNQYYVNDTLKCVPGKREIIPTFHENETIITNDHHLVVNSDAMQWCNGSKYRLIPHLNDDDVFKLRKEGHLDLVNVGVVLEKLQFCVDFFEDSGGFGVIDCLQDEEVLVAEQIVSVGK